MRAVLSLALVAGSGGRVGAEAAVSLQPAADLAGEALVRFHAGKAQFRKVFIAAPARAKGADGLGPLWNARSCQSCHALGTAREASLVLRLSVAGGPEPVYGGQLQSKAVPGQVAEGRVAVGFSTRQVRLADGTQVTLQVPHYKVADLAYGPLAAGAQTSPRIAPQMIGLGLLEAVSEAEVLAREDPGDADGDGISGRANRVADGALGRFGHKAGVESLRAQTALALLRDMGLSSPEHPQPWGDCTDGQVACRAAPDGEEPTVRDGREVAAGDLDLLTFYSANLAVPPRAKATDPEVRRGEAVFRAAGCEACHRETLNTVELPDRAAQTIHPYTDLLLHDMGEGLADHRPDGLADGREWRTAPLWGAGGREAWLHDGRARSLLEAVLWHGGEAKAAQEEVIALTPADRAALLAFLGDL